MVVQGHGAGAALAWLRSPAARAPIYPSQLWRDNFVKSFQKRKEAADRKMAEKKIGLPAVSWMCSRLVDSEHTLVQLSRDRAAGQALHPCCAPANSTLSAVQKLAMLGSCGMLSGQCLTLFP